MQSELPTIVYIASHSKSGSTLLDLMISSHSQVTGLGEVKRFSRRSLKALAAVGREAPILNTCACGSPSLLECDFWAKIDSQLKETWGGGLADLDLYASDLVVFGQHNAALFSAVKAVTSCPFVVDLSKDFQRLSLLYSTGLFNIVPILLMRHPCGTLFSMMKKGKRMIPEAHRYKQVYHQFLDFLIPKNPYLMEYEELVLSTRQVLSEVMNQLHLSLEDEQLSNWSSDQHHHMDGNILRLRKDGVLRLDDDWETRLSGLQKATITCLTHSARTRFKSAKRKRRH